MSDQPFNLNQRQPVPPDTFAGGELLTVESGDQISLLDEGGAVVDTSSV